MTLAAIMQHEPLIRMSVFLIMLLGMMWWEVRQPRRQQTFHRWQRWPSNLGIILLDTLVLRWVFPLAAVGAALYATQQQWGVLPWLGLPIWGQIVLSIVLLDMAIYFQHRIFHQVPWLWRLHRMHHADLEFDVTTGLRFHPLEILLSMTLKILLVMGLGAPAVAVLIFEVILNATSLFNHGNIKLPHRLDRLLRYVLVTPDMHRVHHSAVVAETNSNYGFSVTWWDKIFGTYRQDAAAGQLGLTIGIEDFRSAQDLRLDRMLLQPLRSQSATSDKS